jgi:hypothetical protein
MRHDNISISLPRGYVQSLEEESGRYGFNRSEFVRILFDAYLTVSAGMIVDGKRQPTVDSKTNLPNFFPEIFPHKKEEANEWLHGYLRVVIRIFNERQALKTKTGSVGMDSVSPKDYS